MAFYQEECFHIPFVISYTILGKANSALSVREERREAFMFSRIVNNIRKVDGPIGSTSEYGGVIDLICGRSSISSKKLLSNGSIESSPYTLFNADSSGGEA